MTHDLHKDIKVLHENTEAPRAYFIPFESEKNAKRGIRENSPYFKSLCGEWNFKFFNSQAEIDEDLTDEDLGECGCGCFETINVPLSWQMMLDRGYDVPNYTNINYPYPADPPHIPDETPCAIYTRRFTVTEAMLERDVFINFEGVDSCFYLYINGSYVGYSTVSHCTSEFAVSEYLHEGENTVALLVFKWCSASYLEDQDMWRLSGIFREVYLLCRSKIRISDIYIDTELSEGYTKGKIIADISYVGKKSASYVLYGGGKEIASGKCTTKLSLDIENCKPWSAEAPYLYELYLTVADEVVLFKVGLREYKIEDGVMLVNGMPVKALGVNRHDSHPILGHATPFEHMKNDLLIMKRCNVNIVRTSHYPNDPRFTGLCDELGFYVVDEADLETHGMDALKDLNTVMGNERGSTLTYNPDWTHAYVDRAARLYERDKNRACVVFWSLGNESGCGDNHRAMRDYIVGKNKKNIIHYEGAALRWNEDFADVSPIESRMYPSTEEIKQYLDQKTGKPYFMCEYCHAMGNGPGDLREYVDLVRSEKGFFGGCVWEFTDHSVEIDVPGKDGKKGFTYGGDFGDTPHDSNFCVDGLVYPDRKLHTGILEMKNMYKPYAAELSDFENGEVKITSYRYFTDMSDLDLYWSVVCDGREVLSGREAGLKIAPCKSKKFKLFDPFLLEQEGEYFVNVRLVTNKNTPWASAGHEIGFDQFDLFELSYQDQEERDERFDAKLLVAQDERNLEVFTNETAYLFDKQTGKIEAIIHNGTELISSPVDFNIWRAPTDNDRYVKNNWINGGYDRTVTTLKSFELVEYSEELVQVSADYSLGAKSKAPLMKIKALYTFVSDGSCTVELGVKVNEKAFFLPRFGLTFAMPKGNERMSYYGYGPYESYIDKRVASYVGLFNTTVTENFEPYVRPQENSSHHACRRAYIGNLSGNGLKLEHVYDGEFFSFNAQHYSAKTLTDTAHDYELTPSEETYVSVDFGMSGIGSNSCGPALKPEYKFDLKEFSCAVRITPCFFDEETV